MAGENHAPAALDPAHVGDIEGAFGTLRARAAAPAGKGAWRRRARLLLLIMGPGLIVMGGGNDASGIETYAQAGQHYGMALLWTLVLLFPILFLNQEMVVRLGAVSGVGHARLIFERFGRFWGAFSVTDLLVVNAVTLVTEFIGITQALSFFGVPKYAAVAGTAFLLFAVLAGRTYRYWERFLIALVIVNFLTFPMIFLVHADVRTAVGGVVPQLPGGLTANLLLFLIAVIGTTVEPWQLFFQQASIVDKRIGPRWIRYERADLGLGILLEMLGGVAIMAATAFGLAHTVGDLSDLATTAGDLSRQAGGAVGVLVALALFDGSLIGANIVGLCSTYVVGEVFKTRHSLHWKPAQAPLFYAVYAALVLVSAAAVLLPGNLLGLIIEAVAALNGVLLPATIVFLLLLANDRAVLGPWVNRPWQNAVTGVVVWCLVALSLATTATSLFPDVPLPYLETGLLAAAGVGVIVTLGGDGTNRAVAAACGDVPLVAIS
ncbi:MAG TPA: divalent metal cation transporter, partial [Candidatus Binatia bacterium]|nr:divalent metal cation transporter [Candidatus Binatia bacterium]